MSIFKSYDPLTSAEIEHLNKLEAIVQRGLNTDLELVNALAEISDASLYRATHQTFEAYLRHRWGIHHSPDYQLGPTAGRADPPSTELRPSAPATGPAEGRLAPVRDEGPDSLTNVGEEARHVLGDDDVTSVDIHVSAHRRDHSAERQPHANPGRPGGSEAGDLLARLGWLLTQSSGTIADVAHDLETRAVDLSDEAREQLRDDVLALHEELATLSALLEPVDWDAEHGRLLAGEIPPFEDDPDDAQDE